MRESTLERHAREYARGRGCLCLKFVSPGNQGVPDRLIVSPSGVTGYLEFKAPGKKPTALQAHWQNKLTAQGCACAWVDNLHDAKFFIDSLILR